MSNHEAEQSEDDTESPKDEEGPRFEGQVIFKGDFDSSESSTDE